MRFVFEDRPIESPFVERIWRSRSTHPGTFVSRAISSWEMVIWREAGKNHIVVRGPETGASLAECPANAEFIGIQFKLGAFLQHLPVGQLVDREVLLPRAACGGFWFHSTNWEFPTFENVDAFVERMARADMLARDPVVAAVLEGASPDMSARSVQYRFLHATGLSQRAIYQIERAKQAAALLEGGLSIGDVIDAAGYSDQPHLTRSLRRFWGQTPAAIARAARLA